MKRYVCVCGFIYNSVYGDITSDIEPGTAFEDLPDDWVCPICGLDKSHFEEKEKKETAPFISLK
jgi:rubredoxin